jgi:hypothetical protein
LTELEAMLARLRLVLNTLAGSDNWAQIAIDNSRFEMGYINRLVQINIGLAHLYLI